MKVSLINDGPVLSQTKSEGLRSGVITDLQLTHEEPVIVEVVKFLLFFIYFLLFLKDIMYNNSKGE